MQYHVDVFGKLSTNDMPNQSCNLYVFTLIGFPPSTVLNWRCIPGWEPHWTGYVHDVDTMEAYRSLAGHQPSEFYQLKIIAQDFQRLDVVGTFILPSFMKTKGSHSRHLEKTLNRLSQSELYTLLESTRLGRF